MPISRYNAVSRVVVAALLSGPILCCPLNVFISFAAAQTADDRIVGAPGEVLPLRLGLPPQVSAKGPRGDGNRGLLRIGGVPPSCSLNRGFIAAGTWYVSLDDIERLALLTPREFAGKLVLSINLVQASSRVPINWEVPVEITSHTDASQRQTAAQNVVPYPNPTEHHFAPAIPSAEDTAQLQRARNLLQNNDVASARLVLKRLANANIAEAAFELARTYDPDFLKTIRTSGQAADLAQAQKWYEHAAQLGNQEATIRVDELRER